MSNFAIFLLNTCINAALIDIEKVFDKVSIKIIMESLINRNINKKLRQSILILYRRRRRNFVRMVNMKSLKFVVKEGLKQEGVTSSLLLLSIILDDVIKGTKNKMCALASEQETKKMVALLKRKLKINIEKSMVMEIGKRSYINIVLEGKRVKQVKNIISGSYIEQAGRSRGRNKEKVESATRIYHKHIYRLEGNLWKGQDECT